MALGTSWWCLVLLFLTATLQLAASERFIVKVNAPQTQSCIKHAEQHGLRVLGSAHGLLVLSASSKEAGSRAGSTDHVKQTIKKIQSWPGVQHVEQDQPRYLQPRTLLDSAKAQQGFAMECSAKDKPVSSNTMLPEYVPYGISQIQADSSALPTSIDKSGVMVCIIDSGVDAGHPDLAGNTLDGCKYEDAFAPGGCPFKWSEDYISHGSHVAGTIAAKRDGQGLVGVIPNGAELYVVRVFNDSGDVNQGQGLVYGGTLILAFTQCEGRLAAMQVRAARLARRRRECAGVCVEVVWEQQGWQGEAGGKTVTAVRCSITALGSNWLWVQVNLQHTQSTCNKQPAPPSVSQQGAATGGMPHALCKLWQGWPAALVPSCSKSAAHHCGPDPTHSCRLLLLLPLLVVWCAGAFP